MLLPHDELGSGDAVVLLHAAIADRRIWAEHLAPLAAAGFRAIALDLPGFGDAELPPRVEDAPWRDVLLTMDELGVERAHLIGNSFGGLVAQCVAALSPERVLSLVLVSSPTAGLEPSERLRAAAEADEAALEDDDLEGAVQATLDAWMLPDSSDERRGRVAEMLRRTFEVQVALDPDLEEAEDPLKGGTEALAALGAPSLVIVGEHDIEDFHRAAEELADGLTDPRLCSLIGAGHLAPLECPERFDRLLLSFLAGIAA